MVPQLKLSLAQLLSLRVQHGRLPAEKLRKMMAGDNKTILSSKSVAVVVGERSEPHTNHVNGNFYLNASTSSIEKML